MDIFDAEAHFLSNKVIEIQAGDEKKELTAETIVINTGAVSNVLPIPGLATSKNVFDSTGIQNLGGRENERCTGKKFGKEEFVKSVNVEETNTTRSSPYICHSYA